MKKLFYVLIFFSLSFSDELLCDFFKENNLSGVFIAFDGKEYKSNDFIRARKAFSPASTFKIYNALIALDLGILNDKDEIFYHYKGEKAFLKIWQQDMNLSSAIKYSNALAFKELARKIGLKNMQKALHKLSYGNEKISKIDSFWLDNALQISAKNQTDLLFNLMSLNLEFSKKAQKEVIQTLKIKDGLFYKTGFNDVAWVVGFVKNDKQSFSFALNMDLKDFEKLYLRELLLDKYLEIFIKN